MEVTFYQKNLSKKEGEVFTDYVQKKIPAISALLTNFSTDSHMLRVSIVKFEKHDAFEVEFSLSLPTKPLVAKEASHTITKAVDFAKDRLVMQIKKHLALLRGDRGHKSLRDEEPVESFVEVETMI